MRLRWEIPVLLVPLAAAALARADETELRTGTYLASGSKVTTSIWEPVDGVTEAGDVDQYVFDGFAGQTASVLVTAAPRGLIPLVQLYRPDGTLVSAADGAKVAPKSTQAPGPKASVVHKLDQTGVWTIRVSGWYPGRVVRGDNPDTEVVEKTWVDIDFDAPRTAGDYTVSVKYGAPPTTSIKPVAPNAETGEFRFLVPATGNCTLTATAVYKGGAPAFVDVRAPGGVDLPTPVATTNPTKRTITFTQSIPARGTLGTYVVRFRGNAVEPTQTLSFVAKLKPTKVEKPLKGKLAKVEPIILPDSAEELGVEPSEGGPDVDVGLLCQNLVDAGGGALPRVFLGRIEMTVLSANVTHQGNRTRITFKTPGVGDLPDGTYDVRVLSTTGQAATRVGGFRIVPPPRVESIEPRAGSAAGGFTVRVTGSNFSASRDGMLVKYRNKATNQVVAPPLTFSSWSETHLEFTQPVNYPGIGPGEFFLVVENKSTQRNAQAPMTLELSATAVINRVAPGLVPVLGGETMLVMGANFRATDIVWLETAPNSGTYENITATEALAGRTTFVSAGLHTFQAPARSKGAHRVYIEDEDGYETPTGTTAYYRLADVTASLGFTGADRYDGWTTVLGDFDKDPAAPGSLDLIVSRRGDANTKSATSNTRVLRNDGTGTFTDVTAAVMPDVTADDDWRADKACLADMDLDGYLDLVLATNSEKFPVADSKSHVRILMNEPRSLSGSSSERAFRDRTTDLMAPIRSMQKFSGSGLNEKDDWRALDMFVGDIDVSNLSPPEIVITTDRVFENYYVHCMPYCASPNGPTAQYSFYWGGTRVFKWDASARSGLGRYKFDPNYFPRKSGVSVPTPGPGGKPLPNCKPNSCRGQYPPFIGQKLVVAPLDGDGKPDFLILSSGDVTAYGTAISSLQVALNVAQADGTSVLDVTQVLTDLAAADRFKGDCISIGHPGHRGADLGVVALGKADATGLTSSAIRMLQWHDPESEEEPLGTFEDVTATLLPATTAQDRFQSAAMAFVDVDLDGDDDFLALSRTAPNGNQPALRIFRNETVADATAAVYRESLRGLVTAIDEPTNGYFDGSVLAIGDLDRDGALDYLVTRSTTPANVGPHTRGIRTDK